MRAALLLILSLLPAVAFAEQKADHINKCDTTPSIKTNDYPGKETIVSSNNLALPEGKAVSAHGQKVYIYGRVLDKNCVPVSDVIVEIWQANPKGKYVTSSLEDRLDPYPLFTGTGRAVTDNLGRFNFITLFPGEEKPHHAPHIHFLITHNKFPRLNTEMFFADDTRNGDDAWLNKISPEKRNLLTAKVSEFQHPEDGVAVNWDIILDGTNDFRKF